MVTACPQGDGVGSPCTTSPRVVRLCQGFAEPGRENPAYLDIVSSWSCSPTYPEGLAECSPAMKLGCNTSPPPLISEPAEGWHDLPPWKPVSALSHCLFLLGHPGGLGCLGVIYKNKGIPSASRPKQSPLFNHFCHNQESVG